MRIFIHHDLAGRIVSVSKIEVMDASLKHPHGGLQQEDSVLEVEITSELQKLACHEIGKRFAVDIKKKALKKLVNVQDKDVGRDIGKDIGKLK